MLDGFDGFSNQTPAMDEEFYFDELVKREHTRLCHIKARSLPSVEMTKKELWPRDKNNRFSGVSLGLSFRARARNLVL